MKKFVCTTCGKICYSAASHNDMTNDRCPYAHCTGHVVEAEAPSEGEDS